MVKVDASAVKACFERLLEKMGVQCMMIKLQSWKQMVKNTIKTSEENLYFSASYNRSVCLCY